MLVLSTHKLVFLHIPKNAGSYIKNSLKANFNALRRRPLFDYSSSLISRLAKYITKTPSSFLLLQVKDEYTQLRAINRAKNGHATSQDFIDYSTDPNNYSFLFVWRDPVKRLISFYNYVKIKPYHYLYDDANKVNSVVDFLMLLDDKYGSIKLPSQYSYIKDAIENPKHSVIGLCQSNLVDDLNKLKRRFPSLQVTPPQRIVNSTKPESVNFADYNNISKYCHLDLNFCFRDYQIN